MKKASVVYFSIIFILCSVSLIAKNKYSVFNELNDTINTIEKHNLEYGFVLSLGTTNKPVNIQTLSKMDAGKITPEFMNALNRTIVNAPFEVGFHIGRKNKNSFKLFYGNTFPTTDKGYFPINIDFRRQVSVLKSHIFRLENKWCINRIVTKRKLPFTLYVGVDAKFETFNLRSKYN